MAYWMIRYYVTSPIKQSKNWTSNLEKILIQLSLIKSDQEKKIHNIVQKERIKTVKALKADIENQWKKNFRTKVKREVLS